MCKKVMLSAKTNSTEMGLISVVDKENNNVNPVVAGGYSYEFDRGTLVLLKIVSEPGYHFLKWSDGETSKNREIQMLEKVELTAIFEPDRHVISVEVNQPSWGNVVGDGVYLHNAKVSIEAVPNTGYHFNNWCNRDTNCVVNENPYIFDAKESMSFDAVFEENIKVKVFIDSDDRKQGCTTPTNGMYPQGKEIVVRASANPGYRFCKWSDGVTCNPRIIKASPGLEITAIFEEETPRAMFDGLLNHSPKRFREYKPCPSRNYYNGFYPPSNNLPNIIKDSEIEDCSSWVKKNIPAFLMILIAAALIAALLFVPNCCYGHNNTPTCQQNMSMDSLLTINSIKTNIPIVYGLNGYNHIYANRIIVDSTYYVAKDSVRQQSHSQSQDKTAVHGEIVYNDSSWYILLYILLIAVVLLIAIVFAIKYIAPLLIKKIDFEQRFRERRYNDYVRFQEEKQSCENLQYKTEMSICDKREKAIIDEWQRDNEHERKLDIMEQERIARISGVLIELAKIKNTVTLKGACDNGKTIIIERSILSDDCCAELKSIVENFSKQTDDCCCIIKALLKFLLDNPDCCEKIKKILNCLFCCDKNERKNADITAAIERLIAIVQSHGTSGVQQVVNLGGNSDSSSNHTDDCTNMIISILKNLFNDPVFSQKIEELIKRQSETKKKEGA